MGKGLRLLLFNWQSVPEKRDNKGQFESEHGVTADDVFEFMAHLEPYTTGEIAEELDIPRRTAYN